MQFCVMRLLNVDVEVEGRNQVMLRLSKVRLYKSQTKGQTVQKLNWAKVRQKFRLYNSYTGQKFDKSLACTKVRLDKSQTKGYTVRLYKS